MDVMEEIRVRAQSNPKRIGFPEATDEKTLKASRRLIELEMGQPVLVGNIEEIEEAARRGGLSLEGMEIADYSDDEKKEQLIADYVQKKSLMPASALKRMARDPLYVALMMEETEKIDGTFAGLTHTTGEVIMAGQMILGTKEGINTVSSLGIMDIPGFDGPEGNLLVAADCAVSPDPDSEELADIAITTCDTVSYLLDWEPRAALLSFSTDGSGEHEKAEMVANAVAIAQKKRPDLKIDGEFQLDAAILPAVAVKKVKRESAVAGRANIIIFPDLNAGNIGVKLVQFMAGGHSYGPLLQGLAKPVSDSSRSAPLEEMVGNIAMLVVCAQLK